MLPGESGVTCSIMHETAISERLKRFDQLPLSDLRQITRSLREATVLLVGSEHELQVGGV